MAALNEDLNSSGTAEDYLSFQSLIDLTEERIKGKLSLLKDPEMSVLETQQSGNVDEAITHITANNVEQALYSTLNPTTLNEASTSGSGLVFSDAINKDQDQLDSNNGPDRMVEAKEPDGLERGKCPDELNMSVDLDEVKSDKLSTIERSKYPVGLKTCLPNMIDTENQPESMSVESSAEETCVQQEDKVMLPYIDVYHEDITGGLPDDGSTKIDDTGNLPETAPERVIGDKLDSLTDSKRINLSSKHTLTPADDCVIKHVDDNSKVTASSTKMKDIQEETPSTCSALSETKNVNTALSENVIHACSIAQVHDDWEVNAPQTQAIESEHVVENVQTEYCSLNAISDHKRSIQNNLTYRADEVSLEKKSAISRESISQEDINNKVIEPMLDESFSGKSYSPTAHTRDSEYQSSGRTETDHDLQGHVNRTEDDESMCGITIVSVRGAVNLDNEQSVEITDEGNRKSTPMLDQTDMDHTDICEKNMNTDRTSQDIDLAVCDATRHSFPHDTPTSRSDATEEPNSLMISDVRSLLERDTVVTESDGITTTISADSYSNQNVTKIMNVDKTSEAIDAMQAMCSSVHMSGSGNINQDQGNKAKTSMEPNGVAQNITSQNVISTVNHIPERSHTALPVISDVYSIKIEPKDEYGEYSLAEGPHPVRPNESLSSKNKRKQSFSMPKILKRKTSNCGVIQMNVSYPSADQQNGNGSLPRSISTKPHVLQILKSKHKDTNLPPSIKSVQNRPQKSAPSSMTTIDNVSKTPTTPMLVKGTSRQSKLNKEVRTAPPKVSVVNDLINVKMEPISIRTVGVKILTDLIARKNPIPTYKPLPIPDELKSVIQDKQFPCYECGDCFRLKKSLHNHLSRHSMKIRYKCETCKNIINFTNKCQMLSHLRSHLNINKTQAVPIHIKSDSIEISTYYDDLCQLAINKEDFKFFDDLPEDLETEDDNEDIQKDQCHFCNYKYSSIADISAHYTTESVPKTNIFCDKCPMYLPNLCSMKAHKAIHTIGVVKHTPKVLVCPECGEQFPEKHKEVFLLHLKTKCFHVSRYGSFLCKKCNFSGSCTQAMRNHLLTHLDIYYKCERCPMALRSVKNFNAHFNAKHAADEEEEKNTHKTRTTQAKIIYRCHYCDTLIDDRGFLETHIQNHMTEIKALAGYIYNCVQCGQLFPKRASLMGHYSSKHKRNVVRITYCTFCQKDMWTNLNHVSHILQSHLSSPIKENVTFCEHCGLVCGGEKMLHSHVCLMKIKVLGDHTATDIGKTKGSRKSSKGADGHVLATDSNLRKILPKPDLTPKGPYGDKEYPNLKTYAMYAGDNSTCKACGLTFNNVAHRMAHIKRHRESNIFICICCGDDSFKTYHDVRSHEIVCAAVLCEQKHGRVLTKSSSLKAREKTASTKIKITRAENDEFSVKLVPASKGEEVPAQVEHKCDQCESVFTRKTKLEEHKKLDHGLHPCHLCGLMHDSQSALKKHLILSHEGKKMRYNCFVCKGRKRDRYFTEKAKLEKHLRQKHRLKQWDDSKLLPELPGLEGKGISPEPEKRKLETDSESAEETPVKKSRVGEEVTFKCAKCLFACEIRDEFLLHIKEHNDSLSAQCLECGLCFVVLPSLRKHLFMVHKVRDFEAYCTTNNIEKPKETEIERFPQSLEPDVNVHDDVVTSEEEEEEMTDNNHMECRVCYKEFDTEAGLKSHMRVHGMALIKKLRRKSGHKTISRSSSHDEAQLAESSAESSAKADGVTQDGTALKEPNTDVLETNAEHNKDAELDIYESDSVNK